LAASGPVQLASADEEPLVSCGSSEVLPVSLVLGWQVAEARAASMADGRNRANPEDVLPPLAASLAQAQALPAPPTLAAGLQPPPREHLAESCPGRSTRAAARIAAPHAA